MPDAVAVQGPPGVYPDLRESSGRRGPDRPRLPDMLQLVNDLPWQQTPVKLRWRKHAGFPKGECPSRSAAGDGLAACAGVSHASDTTLRLVRFGPIRSYRHVPIRSRAVDRVVHDC